MRLEEVIQKPLITEKGAKQRELANEYFFAVHPKAGKFLIRLAVEKLFNVKVLSVRTMTRKGKQKKVGKQLVQKPDWKKAVVRLQEKETIKIFEGT